MARKKKGEGEESTGSESAYELINRLKGVMKEVDASMIEDSAILQAMNEYVDTGVPILNLALYGDVDGGLTPGITMISADSKHFKTTLAIILAIRHMEKYPKSVLILLDNEYGAPIKLMKKMGVDMDRVIHIPVDDIEVAKAKTVKMLKALEKEDHAFFLFDSLGSAASQKEVEDAEDEDSASDMTRAKAIKSFFRIITPMVCKRAFPFIVINHVYMEQKKFGKRINSGGSGATLAPNTILFITRSQEKEGDELVGWKFRLISHKSRFVRENADFPLVVTYEGGISKWSGLFDLAIELKYLESRKQGFFNFVTDEPDTPGWRRKEKENSDEFWELMFTTTDFKQKCKHYFMLAE